VIQPHLPIRLPCYDFTPIIDPTFDGFFQLEAGNWMLEAGISFAIYPANSFL